MAMAPLPAERDDRAPTRLASSHPPDLRALREQMNRVRGAPRLDSPSLPTHPLLADLLPGGGLKPGATYSIDSSLSLLLALLAAPSQHGTWCGVLGIPGLGVEAVADAGVDLERLVLVPSPGRKWLAIAAALTEVLPVVALRPPTRPSDADAARLAARLRDRGAVLLTVGPWPLADAVLSIEETRWSGLGQGHGYLRSREVVVAASSRRSPRPRQARMLLPGPNGQIAALAPRQTGSSRGAEEAPAALDTAWSSWEAAG